MYHAVAWVSYQRVRGNANTTRPGAKDRTSLIQFFLLKVLGWGSKPQPPAPRTDVVSQHTPRLFNVGAKVTLKYLNEWNVSSLD